MTPKEILEKSLVRIRTVGWCSDFTGSLSDPTSPLCVLNTTTAVALASNSTDAKRAARGYLYKVLGISDDIGGWNDAPGRTQQEVEDLLEKAIALASLDLV